MDRSSAYCLNVEELSKYLRISYGKAVELVRDISFRHGLFTYEEVLSRAQIATWVEQHINPCFSQVMQPVMQRGKNT